MIKILTICLTSILLICSIPNNQLPDISKTTTIEVVYYINDSVNDSTVILLSENNTVENFKYLSKKNFSTVKSCPPDGHIKYLDSNNLQLLDGLFSLECQTLFIKLNGKEKPFSINLKAIDNLKQLSPFIKNWVTPTGSLGILGMGEKLSKADFTFNDLGACSLIIYNPQNTDDMISGLMKKNYTVIKKLSFNDNEQSDLLKSIDSIEYITSFSKLKDISSRLIMDIVIDKSWIKRENKHVHFPFNYPIKISFYDFNFQIGFYGCNKIYFNTYAQELLKSKTDKIMKESSLLTSK